MHRWDEGTSLTCDFFWQTSLTSGNAPWHLTKLMVDLLPLAICNLLLDSQWDRRESLTCTSCGPCRCVYGHMVDALSGKVVHGTCISICTDFSSQLSQLSIRPGTVSIGFETASVHWTCTLRSLSYSFDLEQRVRVIQWRILRWTPTLRSAKTSACSKIGNRVDLSRSVSVRPDQT